MLIGSRKVDEGIIKQLVKEIKKKKELKNLADNFVREQLKKYLSQNPKKITFLGSKFSAKSANYKQIIKEVRNNLRRLHGLFGVKKKSENREELFKELTETKPNQKKFIELHKRILGTHNSTRERIDFYPELYLQLFGLTGKPFSILDLGCGLNPFSIPFMNLKRLKYFAYDISLDEINLLNRYFGFISKFWKISGKARILNVAEFSGKSRLEKTEVCFLWKMTDLLDKDKGHKISEKVISNIPAKFVIVSFPTVTSSGKPMNRPERRWVELMCRRLSYPFKILRQKNELFYVIKK